MDKVAKYYVTLYQRDNPYPPGRPLATHVYSFFINYDVLCEAEVGVEVEAAVRCLRLHKAGVHTHLRVYHFKTWIREAYPGEIEPPPPSVD